MSTTASIPADLLSRGQWVVWRREDRGDKATKVPYTAVDPSRPASSTDPSTWATVDEALASCHAADGLGYVFAPDDPFVGVDLDDCIDESGELEPWAAEIVEALDSYTERSPSGRGLHVFVRGRLGGSRRRHGRFEVYDQGRYFATTGERVGTRDTVEERQAELDDVLEQMLPKPAPTSANGGGAQGLATPDDGELLARAFRAKNGSRVEALYRGEINGYGSQSEAELGLCSSLAFWAGPDPARLDRLFRASGLMRSKWDEARGESTYGQQTVEKALAGRAEFYEPPAQTPPKGS
jgi:primase-polymerase (primpol)-like protein